MTANVEVHASIDEQGNGHVNVTVDPIINETVAREVGLMVLVPLLRIKRARVTRPLRQLPTAVLEGGRKVYHFAEQKPPRKPKSVGPSEPAQD